MEQSLMMFAIARKYFDTIKYLRPVQIYWQLLYRVKKTRVNLSPPPIVRHPKSAWISPINKLSQLNSPNSAIFLDQERDISSKKVWSDPTIDKLWLYHLHYFDFLHSIKTKENDDLTIQFMKRWINENPPGKGVGWEPYTLSLRIVNWIKWMLAGNQPIPGMLPSLAIQIRYLYKRLEIHILGNHLFANIKALLFAGLFFEGNEADKWLKKGMRLFDRELAEQILADGGHFELSPMYHSIILEDMLDLFNLFKTFQIPISQDGLRKVEKVFYWLNNMCHPDGRISFFNDSAFEIAPTLQQLLDYRNRLLQCQQQDNFTSSIVYLKESGYCRLQQNHAVLLADIANIGASYQPGHAHADTLSFEFSLGNQRIIVNSGISTYMAGEMRLSQRGSKAHNTLVIDDHNSSEIWSSFRVARRANVHPIEAIKRTNSLFVKASHDGYYRSHQLMHTRSWEMKTKKLIIQDDISGFGNHKIDVIYHIHPHLTLEQGDKKNIYIYDQTHKCIASLQMNVEMKIKDSTYHPTFNTSIKNKKIIAEDDHKIPVTFITIIEWK